MKKLLILLIMGASLGAVSCSSTVNTFESAPPQAKPAFVNDKRVITDSSLNDCAYVASINEARPGGLLMIQARIVNSTSSMRQINYKFGWIGANGMEIPAATSTWQTLVLEGREAQNISAAAPNKNAVDFYLKLLPNKRD